MSICVPVFISSGLFFFQGTSTSSSIDCLICIAEIAEPGDNLERSCAGIPDILASSHSPSRPPSLPMKEAPISTCILPSNAW